MSTDIDEAMRSAFEGNFLDASDILATGDQRVKIAAVSAPNAEKDATGRAIDKAIVAFERCKKRLVLNKTNAKAIAMQHGKKPSAWIGKEVTLTVRYLARAFGEQNVPVVRVLPPADVPLTFAMRSKFGSPRPYTPEELTKAGRRGRDD